MGLIIGKIEDMFAKMSTCTKQCQHTCVEKHVQAYVAASTRRGKSLSRPFSMKCTSNSCLDQACQPSLKRACSNSFRLHFPVSRFLLPSMDTRIAFAKISNSENCSFFGPHLRTVFMSLVSTLWCPHSENRRAQDSPRPGKVL